MIIFEEKKKDKVSAKNMSAVVIGTSPTNACPMLCNIFDDCSTVDLWTTFYGLFPFTHNKKDTC